MFRPHVNIDALRLRDGRAVYDLLASWNVAADDAAKLLGQVVPFPVAQMVTGGCWSSMLVLARFPLLKTLFPLQDDFPPEAWLERARPVHRQPVAVPLVASRFLDIASELKKRAIGALGDDENFAGMVEYLQDVASTLQRTAVESPQAKAMRQIRQALLSHHVKNMRSVGIVASHAMSLFFPESEHQLEQKNLMTKVGDDHFKLDLALCLTQRDINFAECFVRFALADSSPQGLFDFMMWKEMMVAVKDLSRVAEAIRYLQTSRGGVLYEDDEQEVSISMITRREAANKVLEICIICHTYVPATMGQGNTGAQDKVAVSAHQMSTETWDIAHLFRHLMEYFSYTSDMGTEVKVPDFQLQRSAMNMHLPSWLAGRTNRSPLLQEDSGEASSYSNPFVQCDTEDFMPNAIALPGANHLIHNIVKCLHEPMPHYSEFVLQLKVLERLLTHPGRKERLIAKCMLGTPYGEYVKVIRRFSMTLHEPRWHSTVAFCKAAVRPVGILRRCWREADYTGAGGEHELHERDWHGGGPDGGKKIIPSELTAILRSALFRFYLHMLIVLKAIPTKAAQWFDGCPCHQELIIGKTAHFRRKALRDDGLSLGICPCMSCRGWEVVDGVLDRVIKDLAKLSKDSLEALISERATDGLTVPLTDSDMNVVMSELLAGIVFLQAGFAVKLSFSKHLPYILMGLACPLPARRQHWAIASLSAYAAKPEDQHHPKSVAFMREGTPLRQDMEALAATGATTPLLDTMITPFLLMPFGDRLIEMVHKPLSDIAKANPHTKHGDKWSIQRMQRIERSLEDPVWKDKFVNHFINLVSAKSMIFALGFERHPVFDEFLNASVPVVDRTESSYHLITSQLKERDGRQQTNKQTQQTNTTQLMFSGDRVQAGHRAQVHEVLPGEDPKQLA